MFDQWGRPIKGAVREGKPIYFDKCSHAQLIAALAEERIEWTALTWAGWPQIPYDQLKALKTPPAWPFAKHHTPATTTGQPCTCVMCSIRDPQIRKDAIRIRREVDEALEREMAEATAVTEE